MKNVIYQIRNVVNGKIYIGSAVDSRVRFEKHRRHLRKGNHHCAHLQASWNKHGEDIFKFEILEVVEGDLLEAEQRWIDQFYGNGKCYNTARYAGAPMRGRTHSEKTLELLKEVSPKGEKHYLYGKKRTEEVKTKLSAALKGKPNKMKGKQLSEQGKNNITASAKHGQDSHFYGKPPVNIEELKKPILAILPDRTEKVFDSMSDIRNNHGASIATIIRACKSGKPIKSGNLAGWVLSYQNGETNIAPIIPTEYLEYPRTRKSAIEIGSKFYFTGIPCDRGHIALRLTKGVCEICRKEDWKTENDKRKEKHK